MKPLAEIAERPAERIGAGALRHGDVEAFESVLDQVGSRVLLVTGAGDGRRVLSTGLAAAAAASGRRTALLECDLGQPALAETLGLAASPGLAEYLRGEAEAAQLLQPLVIAGPGAGEAREPLVCVVAGSAPDRDGGLAADGFGHAVEKLRHGYRLVVLHGPPLGDESGDLREAAAQVDAVLACVGPALARGRSGRRLARALAKLPAPRAEVVVYGDAQRS